MPDHLVCDVSDGTDGARDWPFGIHQRLEHDLAPAAVHHRYGYLGDSVTRDRPAPGGLHIHYGEGAVVEQRRALRLLHQRPAAVSQLAHPWIRPEQSNGHPLADDHWGAE